MDLNQKLYMNFQFNNQNQNFFDYFLYMNQLMKMMEINIMKMNEINIDNNNFLSNKSDFLDKDFISVLFRAQFNGKSSAPIMIQCSVNDKILEVVQNYRNKSCDLDSSKKFVYNGKALDLNNNKTIKELKIVNNANIFVVSTKDVKRIESKQYSSKKEESSDESSKSEDMNKNENISLRMNITFTNNYGKKMFLNVSQNDTVSKLLNLFFLKIGNQDDKSIIFLYNGKKLNLDDHRQLFEVFEEKKKY